MLWAWEVGRLNRSVGSIAICVSSGDGSEGMASVLDCDYPANNRSAALVTAGSLLTSGGGSLTLASGDINTSKGAVGSIAAIANRGVADQKRLVWWRPGQNQWRLLLDGSQAIGAPEIRFLVSF